jgi:hypothetical protein
MSKYTHEENRMSLQAITLQAFEAGLLKENQRLYYDKGNGNYAVPTRIKVEEFNEETQKWEYISHPAWVPEFTYKDGPTAVGKVLTGVANVLWAIIMHKRQAELDELRK